MNYLTAALQLVTLYGLYRLWTKEANVNIRLESDRPFEARQGDKVYQSALKEGSELANVKPEPKPKQAPPPPPVKHVYSKQMSLEMDEPKPTTHRRVWTYTDAQINLMLVRMRNYSKERRLYNIGAGPRPKVEDVFPPAGGRFKQCIVPHIIDEKTYKAWRIEGQWPAFLTMPNDKAIETIRRIEKMSK